jgi:hypothetical protein
MVVNVSDPEEVLLELPELVDVLVVADLLLVDAVAAVDVDEVVERRLVIVWVAV